MSTKHHLSEQILMGYSAGVLPEAFNLVVASHLCLSDEARAMQCCYDAIGGAVLAKCEQERMSKNALAATMHQIKTCACDDETPQVCSGIFPEPLQSYVGGSPEAIRWKRVGKGVRQAIIPTGEGATARLFYVPAGQAVPDHGHKGIELTLVLQGAFTDADQRYRRGDIEISTPDTIHRAVAEPGKACICLSATDTPLRFKKWIHRLFGIF